MDTGKSALGLDGNVAAALGYPIGIIAIISLVMEKENNFVRFHAIQALVFYVAMIILMVALWIISGILLVGGAAASAAAESGAAGGLAGMLIGLLWLVFTVIWIGGVILCAVKAYQGALFKLPIIGNMAAKWAGV